MQPVTIAVTNFNGEDVILETLASAKSMSYPAIHLLVVDDGSTDRSVERIVERYPEVRVVQLPRNTGRLNLVRNAALEASETRLVFLVDNDVTFDARCLGILVEAMSSLSQAAICTPTILQSDDRRTVYSGGHRLHYLCVSTDELRGTRSHRPDDAPWPSVGGGIQLIDKQELREIGFFNQSFALGWGDDGELHHRVHLCGKSCYSVPRAVVYHPPASRRPRSYGQIHNRWLTLLQSYSLRTIVLCLPALLLYELLLLSFLAGTGELAKYAAALRTVWAGRARWRAERRRIQSLRSRHDRDLLSAGRIFVASRLLNRPWQRAALRSLNALFALYWRLIRGLV